MKKSILKNLIALTFALGALVFVAGNVFGNPPEGSTGPEAELTEAAGQECGGGSGAECPGGTQYVHATGSKSERQGCDLVFYRADGHWIYCPSTGEVIEDNTQWLWVFTHHGYYC